MKPLLWFAIFVFGQLPITAQENDAAIEGSVVRFGTSERLANVDVVARSEQSGQTTEYHARTDDQGNFLFEKVPADLYVVSPQSPGYFLPPNGVARIAAHKGERIRNINLSLMRESAIHGRVLQPDGQPAAGVSVELVKASPARKGMKILMPTGEPTKTGVNGEYRFAVVPGEYYIRTVTAPGGPQARTYFPNAFDPGDAKATQLSQGADFLADIHVSATPVFKITGRIVDLLPDREPHYFSGVSLSSKSSAVREYKLKNPYEGIPFCCAVISVPDSNVFVTLSNDRFEISGVRPGSYELNAGILVGDAKPGTLVLLGKGDRAPYSISYGGRTTVEVTNADIADIKVEVRHGADLKGRIVSNGKSIGTKDTAIFLHHAEYRPDSFEVADVDKTGRFAFPNLQDGAYSLTVGTLPDDAFVVEVRHGGRKLSGTEFIVNRANPEPLEIIVNPTGGRIDGHVENGSLASILLLPAEGPTRFDLLQNRWANQSGDFTIRGVAPGEYRILAFKAFPPEVSLGATPLADFVGPYETQGTPLTVKPGGRTRIGLGLTNPSVK